MQDYKKIEAWKSSYQLVKLVYAMCDQLPSYEEYGLKSQLRRASISIPSNIAEGYGRNSQKELARFLSIACGSSYELETQINLVNDLKLCPEDQAMVALAELNKTQRMLIALMSKIKATI